MHTLTRLCTATFALVTVGWLAQAQNLVPNPSFEQGDGRRPRAWRTETWGGEGVFAHANVGRTGNRSVELSSERGGDLSWTANVPVDPFARYRLSGWIRTEGLKPLAGARGALLNVHNLQGVATPAVAGTSDWTRVETEFDTTDQGSVQLNCLFGGWGQATGKAWYDDLALEKIAQREPPPRASPSTRRRSANRWRPPSTASSSSTSDAASTAASGRRCSRIANSSTPSRPSTTPTDPSAIPPTRWWALLPGKSSVPPTPSP
ncbi:MAG: hypothetical protein M5U12_00515 [Verrucomicrobia bacterium]|nr:hypothetical protein [Verrucomicrobiota bacterium]